MCKYLPLPILLISLSFIASLPLASQTLPIPTILEVKEDDRVATLYWNSKTQTYHTNYDPDKQAGISSYLIEWGKESEGFTASAITPYRVHMIQPLEPGVRYIARVYNLGENGRKSQPSTSVTFQHDDTRVNAMRARLNGFFDDMNYPMGAFPEENWNQSYSGCTTPSKLSQHINNQFHGHNVVASGYCDRGIASSRLRHPFDFTNRTGTIEFDLDGSQKGRQFWYLDITPFNRKRDLGGHVSLSSTADSKADPPHMLRIVERGTAIFVQLADDNGNLKNLPNRYRNGACGEFLQYCPDENLSPLINVRRHWKIQLSKTEIKIFINDILVIDCSLVTTDSPQGLVYEVAQLNWILFSYNTTKENILLSMIHWDNFGIDAPPGYTQQTLIHNYTDGQLGTEAGKTGNESSLGLTSTLSNPGISTIPIPDQIRDTGGNYPSSAELMFTIQGSVYNWTTDDSIQLNGHTYMFPQPVSSIPGFTERDLISSIKPHSVVLPIDPAHLITGNNEIKFFLSNPRLLNIHIELTYPINQAPAFSPPSTIFSDHQMKLMAFHGPASTVGPGIVFSEIGGFGFWENEFVEEANPRPGLDRLYIKQTPVSDSVELKIEANSIAQLAATGKAKGIAYYEIWMDEVPIKTIRVDEEQAVGRFSHTLMLDIRGFADGQHELFVQAYDTDGNASQFDAFQANALPGEYMPVVIEVQNSSSLAVEYTSFIVYEQLGKAELRWETQQEIGSDHFLIERSVDGQVFEQIGRVPARGTNSEYAFTDRHSPVGKLYYRLKEIEIDGSYSYSEVRTVNIKTGMSLKLMPNPVGALMEVEIGVVGKGDYLLELMDMRGRVLQIREGNLSSQSKKTFQLSTKNLSAGVYVIRLQADELILYKKVVKE